MQRRMVIIRNKPVSSCPACGSKLRMDTTVNYTIDQYFDCGHCEAHLVVHDYIVREEVGV